MSDYLYAVIPYNKGTSLYSPDELEEGLSEPIIPELKGIYSEYAEEDGLKLFGSLKVIFDHVSPFLPGVLGNACISVPGQIHEIPVVIDEEMIDSLCLAWFRRGLG